MSDINLKYENKHLANIASYQELARKTYLKTINKIFRNVGNLPTKSKTFRISNYPLLNSLVGETLTAFSEEIELLLINGIKSEWELSGEKLKAIVADHYADTQINEAIKQIIGNTHEPALNAFLNRTKKGLNLSDRVWNLTNQFRSEIEQTLFVGISEGKSAADMARDAKQYLNNPDKLFRRVRDAEGKLVLSKNAKDYHPGQGVYRSSYKNALRLTATETNMAYRKADMTRWDATPFILGYRVKLSNNHPKFDVCDYLAHDYPSSFIFTGWHPFCRCYSVPILADYEQFQKYQDAVWNGTEKDFKFSGVVKDIHADAKSWLRNNKERVANWKSKPYWIVDNKNFVKKYLK